MMAVKDVVLVILKNTISLSTQTTTVCMLIRADTGTVTDLINMINTA